jgi:prepilin-type N-terminal cleavage/methylation domain-containing protein
MKTQRGFTIVELMVAAMITSIIGGIAYAVLNSGLILFAKNTAINVAHQQARVAVLQIESDLHSAVSLPKLVDASRNDIAGVGPAAGISFQVWAAGPFRVSAPAAAGQNQVNVALGTYVPRQGQRLIIPTHQIELDLAADCPGSGSRNVVLSGTLLNAIETTLTDGTISQAVDVMCFITDRITYVVNNGELRYYGRSGVSTMANDITSAQPFSTPTTPAGAPHYRFVAAINLSTADPSVSNRNFKAANMFLNSMVPCRARLCAYQ